MTGGTAMSGNPPPQLAPLQGAALLLLTLAIAVATFMEVLDLTIVNVSVPAIAGTLGVSPTEGTWTITAYSLTAAIVQPLTGWLAQRFGEVRVFVASTLLFVLCSALCGLATSMPMLVTGRLLQGAVSGPMAPMAQSLLMRIYPPERRGLGLGIWGMVIFVAPIFGPTLGGLITDDLSWPWLFYINVPVGLISGAAVWAMMRRRETARLRVPVDVVGLVLLFAGIGALQFMLDNGNDRDWFGSPVIVAAAIVAVLGLVLLVAWELTDRHPVVNLRLLQNHNFRIGLIVMCLGSAGMFGITIIYPLYLETTAGFTATWAGLATAPVGILSFFLMPWVGANIKRLNLRVAASFGVLTMGCVGVWLAQLDVTASFFQISAPRLLQGVGTAFFFMPIQQIMFSDLEPRYLAAAAGISNFARTISVSIATAGSIWLWSARTTFHHAALVQHVAAGPVWDDWSARLSSLGIDGATALVQTDNVLMVQARVLAANDDFWFIALLLAMVVPTIWLARPPFRNFSSETVP